MSFTSQNFPFPIKGPTHCQASSNASSCLKQCLKQCLNHYLKDEFWPHILHSMALDAWRLTVCGGVLSVKKCVKRHLLEVLFDAWLEAYQTSLIRFKQCIMRLKHYLLEVLLEALLEALPEGWILAPYTIQKILDTWWLTLCGDP